VDDPFRMFLVVRRGAFEDLETGGVLAGAAAVACLERFEHDAEHADAIAQWRERPGKVTLRARGGQWPELLQTEAHAIAGEADGASVVALPPRRRSERGPLLERLQAMSSALTPAPTIDEDPQPATDGRVTYLLNPSLAMSTGKTLAQIAHAATMAATAPGLRGWVGAGCPARVLVPTEAAFRALCGSNGPVAEVVDAGLTEVPPGTVTVLALAPA
jgi:peptidyl-tRNA hydrolase